MIFTDINNIYDDRLNGRVFIVDNCYSVQVHGSTNYASPSSKMLSIRTTWISLTYTLDIITGYDIVNKFKRLEITNRIYEVNPKYLSLHTL
jgi:hypothetical protein